MRPGLFHSPGRIYNDEICINASKRMEDARMASENVTKTVSLKDYIIDMKSATVKGAGFGGPGLGFLRLCGAVGRSLILVFPVVFGSD